MPLLDLTLGSAGRVGAPRAGRVREYRVSYPARIFVTTRNIETSRRLLQASLGPCDELMLTGLDREGLTLAIYPELDGDGEVVIPRVEDTIEVSQ